MRPETRQTGQEVVKLRQLDLHLALPGAGPLTEDLQDQARAVHHLTSEDLLQIASLPGRQFVVENDRVDPQQLAVLGELPGLAGPDVGGRRDAFDLLHAPLGDLQTGGPGQLGQFVQRVLDVERIPGLELDAHEEGAVGAADDGIDQSFQMSPAT